MNTITVKLRSLREHPAQMRTEMDPEEMARLVLQVYVRGLDEHQPIVAAENGDGAYRVISGHRRWLAALLAEKVKARLDGRKDGADLDFARQVVSESAARPTEVEVCVFCQELLEETQNGEGWCPHCESWVEVCVEPRKVPSPSALPEAYDRLTEQHGGVEVTIALFEGGEKEEILALQAANFGQETPDLLGQAKSYAAAMKAGATADEIVANTGQSVSRVKAVMALSKVPESLAQAVAAGEVALGVAAAVARLRKKVQREGMTRYVLEQDVTVEGAQQIASVLRKWQPPSVSLDLETTPKERNQARLLAALWNKVTKEDPARTWYAAACSIATRQIRLSYLGVEGDERELLYQLVPEARCENCRLRELLQAAPMFSYPCYPCQQVEEPGVCFAGVFDRDPFYVQVPFGWEGYPGVQRTPRTPACLSPEEFEQALEAATAEREEEGGDTERDGNSVNLSEVEYSLPRVTKVENVAAQRALIRSYMEQHGEMSGARHPLATRCENCRYRLDGSPTQNPTVPPCQWAARRRNVEFRVRVPVEDESEGPEIPLCRQFGPACSWNDIVPEHPSPPRVPRAWMVGVMKEMVEAVERRKAAASDSRLACEILTGRPLKASESHKGWFLEGLRNEIGNLSDGQLWMLVMWVTADWMRDEKGRYLLPLADGRVLRYAERAWQPPAESDRDGESG